MENELKNCPFCGRRPNSSRLVVYDEKKMEICCDTGNNCPHPIITAHKEDAIRIWNTRADNKVIAEQKARIEELQEALEWYANNKMWVAYNKGKYTTVSWETENSKASILATHYWRGVVGEAHPNEMAVNVLKAKEILQKGGE